jgi:hypothetical protein
MALGDSDFSFFDLPWGKIIQASSGRRAAGERRAGESLKDLASEPFSFSSKD